MPLAHISAQLAEERLQRLDSAPQLRPLMEERGQLPVYPYRPAIVNAIANSRVTLIRGETGCGKTTQVSVAVGTNCLPEFLV